jgi:hypothetical protein
LSHVKRPKFVNAVYVIRVGVGKEHRVNARYVVCEALRAQVGSRVYKNVF